MTVSGFDHVAIPTERPDEMMAFYRALGFTILGEAAFRAGTAPAFAIGFGANKINVHGPGLWKSPQFTLRGPAALPGCGDFCFAWEGTAADLLAALARVNAPIEVGPVQREGGRGTTGTSHYTRDPDNNLLEFIIYP